MRENLGEGMLTMHQVHHPEITVDGDTATARWYLQDKVIVPAFGFMLEGAAFYADRYVRTPEGWRVAHTGYRAHLRGQLQPRAGTSARRLRSESGARPVEHTHVLTRPGRPMPDTLTASARPTPSGRPRPRGRG